ncbi:MAG: lysine--tRNA ligase [Theionarchaea archaeon]|nr:lysine--tRNA ligase [Theionarchaea archaeon]MBU7038701.1 lysine--tRNA ligase [Theionarchaea archaeon]
MIFWADKTAEKIIRREKKLYRTECGLGASGIPHVGSVGDGIRAYAVTLALEDRGVPSEFVAFSDDRDGLRKVPRGFPAFLEEHIGRPVSTIPDPFECHTSYGEHMSSLLLDALDKVGVRFVFQSGTMAYEDGTLDDVVVEALNNWKEAGQIIFEMTGQKKYLEQLPFNVICSECGKIYTTRAYEWIPEKKKILYVCDQEFKGADSKTGKELTVSGCGHRGEASIRDGKLTWKVEFAARWKALDISFEAFGKDILDSVRVNDHIAKEIFHIRHPVHAFYELFIERGGGRISKSKGNVFTPQVWLSYGSPESLRLLMLKRLGTTRVVDVEEIPKFMNEVDSLKKIFFGKEKITNEREEQHVRRLYEYVTFLHPPDHMGLLINYYTLVQLARMLPKTVENRFALFKDILMRSGLIDEEFSDEELCQKIEYATNWVEEAEEAEEEEVSLSEPERSALRRLAEKLPEYTDGEQIQELIFLTAQEHQVKPGRFFQVLYRVVIGTDRGPRAGTLISGVGPQRVSEMIMKAI